jgi:hypothetical protein
VGAGDGEAREEDEGDLAQEDGGDDRAITGLNQDGTCDIRLVSPTPFTSIKTVHVAAVRKIRLRQRSRQT